MSLHDVSHAIVTLHHSARTPVEPTSDAVHLASAKELCSPAMLPWKMARHPVIGVVMSIFPGRLC